VTYSVLIEHPARGAVPPILSGSEVRLAAAPQANGLLGLWGAAAVGLWAPDRPFLTRIWVAVRPRGTRQAAPGGHPNQPGARSDPVHVVAVSHTFRDAAEGCRSTRPTSRLERVATAAAVIAVGGDAVSCGRRPAGPHQHS